MAFFFLGSLQFFTCRVFFMGGAGSSMADTCGTGSAYGNRVVAMKVCKVVDEMWESLHAMVFLQLLPRSAMYRTLAAENGQGLPVSQAGGMLVGGQGTLVLGSIEC